MIKKIIQDLKARIRHRAGLTFKRAFVGVGCAQLRRSWSLSVRHSRTGMLVSYRDKLENCSKGLFQKTAQTGLNEKRYY